ncbi:MAG: hypothetical protein J0L92_02770 [Deltaproteobacteria bacterium]|nr:hypothetical protein [Deltaproteobacteria bacterium]
MTRHIARSAAALALTISLTSIAGGCLAPPNVCRGDPGGATPTDDTVCDHLASLSCLAGPIPEFVDGGPEVGPVELGFDAAGGDLRTVHATECRAGYASWEASVGAEHFAALTRCYVAARNCEEVEACNRGCELVLRPDAGSADAPSSDGGATDANVDVGIDAR